MAEVSFVLDLVLRCAAAAWLVACTTLAAYAVARRLTRGAGLLERAVAVIISALWLASVGFHALASVRAYALPQALLACGLLAAVTQVAAPGTTRALTRDLRAIRRVAQRALHGRERAWNLCFAVCALPVLLRPWLVIPLGWDSLTYHAVKAALFVQHQGALPMRAPGTWNWYGPRWAGSELISSWVMLPFHSDLLASGSETLQWLGLGVAVFALARRLGAEARAAGAAAGMCMALPALRLLIGSGYSEPLACLCVVAACLFVVHYLGRRSAGAAVLACAAIGLGLGMKITYARACAVLLGALALYVAMRPPKDAPALRTGLVAALALLAVIAPWALHTLHSDGLPLSPMPISVLGVELGRASPEVAWLMDRPQLLAAPGGELRTLGIVFGLGEGRREVLTALALIPLCGALFQLVTGPRAWALPVVILAFTASADVFTYFSAELAPVRLQWPHTSSRFLLVAVLIATAISVRRSMTGTRLRKAYVHVLRAATCVLLVGYVGVGWSWTSALASAGVLLGCVVGVAIWRLRVQPRAGRVALRTAYALLLLCALALGRDALRYPVTRSDFAIHPLPLHWVDAAEALDQPGRKLRIAVTGGPAQDMDRELSYPFFGRHLQNELLYVTPLADGRIGHYGGPGAFEDFVRSSDPTAWVRRLRRAAVTHVVTFDPISVERVIMDENPHLFRRISAPELKAFGVFELGAQPPPPPTREPLAVRLFGRRLM